MTSLKQSWDNCWVKKFESIVTTEGKFPISISATFKNDNRAYLSQFHPNVACFLSWLGSPTPWASRPMSRRKPRPAPPLPAHLTHPHWVSTLAPGPASPLPRLLCCVFLLVFWYTQLLSGRISRRKPYDLLIRSPEDSFKLKPGPLKSYKHQGMQQPKFGLFLRTGNHFFSVTILLSELKRPASSKGLPSKGFLAPALHITAH